MPRLPENNYTFDTTRSGHTARLQQAPYRTPEVDKSVPSAHDFEPFEALLLQATKDLLAHRTAYHAQLESQQASKTEILDKKLKSWNPVRRFGTSRAEHEANLQQLRQALRAIAIPTNDAPEARTLSELAETLIPVFSMQRELRKPTNTNPYIGEFQTQQTAIIDRLITQLKAYPETALLGDFLRDIDQVASSARFNPTPLQDIFDKAKQHSIRHYPRRRELAAHAQTLAEQDKAIISNVASLSDAALNEITYKELFLRTLNTLLEEEGYPLDTREMLFHIGQERKSFFGTQALTIHHDFHHAHNNGLTPSIGNKESTTPYHFDFNFYSRTLPDGGTLNEPIFIIDQKVWDTLKDFGVSDEDKERYSTNFTRMADMAEHDYLHGLIIPLQENSKHLFSSTTMDPSVPSVAAGSQLEHHALGLHAQICARLFTDQPKRKAHVLQWAADTFEHLAATQNTALANATNDTDRQKIHEAITYLSEIYAHRLFRVFSPDEQALREPLRHGKSVAECANKVEIITPFQLGIPDYEGDMFDSLARMARNCEMAVSDLYTQIHQMKTSPMRVMDSPISINNQPGRDNTKPLPPQSLVQVVGNFSDALPESIRDGSARNWKDSVKPRAERMQPQGGIAHE
jgi:AraC-like DNA-binding protein